ncbi:MAG: hypothetical protein V4692_04270, partial [Bdellovibrionota bacterium]
RPWRQIMSKSELGQYNNHRIEWTIDTKSTVPVIETSWEKAMVFEDASIAAKLVSTKMTGNDLVFEFEIPEQIEVAGTGVTKTRDFLILSYGSQVFEIEGLRNQTKKNSVTFNLRGAGLRMAGEIKPLNIEVEPLTRNLARHYYVRTRIFMDRSEAVKLTGATPTAPIVLNDLEVLGENLKFVFDSSTELSTLKIGIRIQTSKLTVSTVHSQGEPSKEMGRGTMALPVHDTILTLGPEDLVQKFENGKLVVTTKLGRNTVAKLYAETDITPPDLPGWGKKIRMIEETWTEVSPARELLRIEAVNESGVMLRKFLDKPVKYGP